ncbi:MAG: hypothetical protein WCJ64_02995 [Rhodospirillaceae bacterium]
MRIVVINNLNRSDEQHAAIDNWLSANVDTSSILVCGDAQHDKMNGALFFQFDNTQDAIDFVVFLYITFPDLILSANIDRERVRKAAAKTKRKSNYAFQLYSAGVCYAKMEGPSCREIQQYMSSQATQSK